MQINSTQISFTLRSSCAHTRTQKQTRTAAHKISYTRKSMAKLTNNKGHDEMSTPHTGINSSSVNDFRCSACCLKLKLSKFNRAKKFLFFFYFCIFHYFLLSFCCCMLSRWAIRILNGTQMWKQKHIISGNDSMGHDESPHPLAHSFLSYLFVGVSRSHSLVLGYFVCVPLSTILSMYRFFFFSVGKIFGIWCMCVCVRAFFSVAFISFFFAKCF